MSADTTRDAHESVPSFFVPLVGLSMVSGLYASSLL